MGQGNVTQVVSVGLCCSCGLCEPVCPVGGIAFEMSPAGSWIPRVSTCCGCGRCLSVCPGRGASWSRETSARDQVVGRSLASYSARSLDDAVFRNSTSGGVATQLVKDLLSSRLYDVAFLVGEAVPGRVLHAEPHHSVDGLVVTQKSKYLQVSYAGTLRWMMDNPRGRAIIVAVPCAVRGLLNAIDLLGLDRGNYLLVGLFCDKTMQYHVLGYLSSLGAGSVEAVDFRNKEISGWPGDVGLRTRDDGYVTLPKERRMEVKDYFCPERCLYCLDKLNALADISLGDDYTGSPCDDRGANSVIVRTSAGLEAWRTVEGDLLSVESPLDAIARSQRADKRIENLAYSRLKEEAPGVACINKGLDSSPDARGGFLARWDMKRRYRAALRRISIGGRYAECPELLGAELKRRRSLPGRIALALDAAVHVLLSSGD